MDRKRSNIATMLGLTALLAGAWACQTSSGAKSSAKVDKVRGEVTLFTNRDTRSSLVKTSSRSGIKEAENQLRSQTRQKDDPQTWLSLAELQLAKGDLTGAETSARRGLRHDLKNLQAKRILAEVAFHKGKFDLAEVTLNGIGGARSKDSKTLNLLALISLERKDHARAMSLLKQAINVNGRDLSARMNLGVLYLKYRQVQAAGTQFERVLKVMPTHRDAKLHLAVVKTALGQSNIARKMLTEVLNEDETNPVALYNLAVLENNGQEYDDALDRLKSYIKSSRGSSEENDQVFALIDEIQARKAAAGKQVSDEEIQSMAAQMVKGGAPGTESADERTIAVADETNSQPETPVVTETDTEVEALEAELAH